MARVSVGGEADANLPVNSLEELPPHHVAHPNYQHNPVSRYLSCFYQGFLVIQAAIFNHLPLPFGRFFPTAWPSFFSPPDVSLFTCHDEKTALDLKEIRKKRPLQIP